MKKVFIWLNVLCSFLIEMNAQKIETLSFKKDSDVILNNWQLFLTNNANDNYKNYVPVKIVSSIMEVDKSNELNYQGSCWFKKLFRVDSTFDSQTISFQIKILGAAEFYLNKKLIKKIGLVSNSKNSEHLVNSEDEFVSVNIEKGIVNELLVRFSNHQVESSYDGGGNNIVGFELRVEQTDALHSNILSNRLANSNAGTLFFVFFITFCFFHFVIFMFNKKQIANLYYSAFCLFVSLLILALFGSKFTDNNDLIRYTGIFAIISPILIFLLLPVMLRSFFGMLNQKWYWFVFLLGILCFVCFIFSLDFMNSKLLITLILISSVESFRILYLAFINKKKGVKIIGTGFVFFIFFVAFISFGILFTNGVNISGGIFELLFVFLILLSIFSIPISITVFLAYSISLTNKYLSKKLNEVEELSAQAIEQEKEKQKYLENQKQVLEEQVIERTHEISAQKQIIEDKNKDIIDSINYAKRIQTSILPAFDYFKSVFANSFIFYEPRDIVSGDFYYVTEINNSKILFCADCTGHGVPGALMSMVGSNLIHKIIHEHKIYEPKLILETLHDELRNSLKQNVAGSSNRDGMDACVIAITNNELTYSGANRPLIYIDSSNCLQEIKATKTPLGGSHIEKVDIMQHCINRATLKEFYLFSDGFVDQFGGPEGKKLMVLRFKKWLQEITYLSAEEKQQFITSEFMKWKNNLEQVDDVMVIGITL